jgi:PIN like domain
VPREACFLDESIDSPEIAVTLRHAGVNVITFTERFARGTEDEIWLDQVRDRGWLLFTRDNRWHHHRAELLAIISARARAFIFTSQGSAAEIAHVIWVALPRVAAIADENVPPAPYIYKASPRRAIEIIYPSAKFRFPLR